MVAPLTADQLGDPTFQADYNVKYGYKTGAMANGIASEALVIAMGQAGMIGSFGAAGLVPKRVNQAIDKIQAALPTQSHSTRSGSWAPGITALSNLGTKTGGGSRASSLQKGYETPLRVRPLQVVADIVLGYRTQF